VASQIAHIIYAKKYFDAMESGDINHSRFENYSWEGKINRDEFFLGSVFPDIRRIEPSIKRQVTHLHFSEVDLDFRGLNSFEAGWKFHLFCDMRREEILNHSRLYDIIDGKEWYNLPAKLLEDILVYDDYNNWEKTVNYFNNPPFFNTGTGASPETFFLWYAALAKYMEKKPDEKSIRILTAVSPLMARHSKEISKATLAMRKNSDVVKILSDVKNKII
jgi:hypothetical protein